MKVLMINKFLWPNGGAEGYMKGLSEELEKRGHEVNFFGMESLENTMLNKEGLYVQESNFHSKNPLQMASYVKRILYSKEAKTKLVKVIEDFKPDIVHLHNFNFQLTPSILDAIPDNIPVVMTLHDTQLICPNHLMYIPSKEKRCQECLKCKTTINCVKNKCTHDSRIKSIFSAMEGQMYRHNNTYKKINLFLCPSRFMQKTFLQDKRFSDRLAYLPNFVNAIGVPKESAGKGNYILYFGRISPEKGIRNIVKAASRLNDIEFRIVGSGEMELGETPKNLKLLGRMEGEDLYNQIINARLVIAPSICYENNPLAVIEAQQLGCAVLVPAYGGAAELTSGPQIFNETSGSLIDAIRNVYYNDDVLEKMRKDSVLRASKYMTVEDHVSRIEKIYQKLLGASS